MNERDRSPGRPAGRPVLTSRMIAQAALKLVEQHGLDGLSMRRLADDLNVQPASLYWHVPGKEQLIDLMADELLAELRLPRPSPRSGWRRVVRDYALGYYGYLVTRRDSSKIIARAFPSAPSFLPHGELLGEQLLRAGFSARDAAGAIDTIIVYVHGFVTAHQTSGETEPDEAQVTPAARVRLLSLSPADFPAMAAIAGWLARPDIRNRVEFGLDRLLDGLELLNSQKTSRRTARHEP